MDGIFICYKDLIFVSLHVEENHHIMDTEKEKQGLIIGETNEQSKQKMVS